MRPKRGTKRALASLVLGVLTSYLTALAIGRWSYAVLYDYPRVLQPPPPVVWLDPTLQTPTAALPEYWVCTTMHGFGRRIETAARTPGLLQPVASSRPEQMMFWHANSIGEVEKLGRDVRVSTEPPPALHAVGPAANIPAPNSGVQATMVSSAGWPFMCVRGWRNYSAINEELIGLWGPSITNARSSNDWIPYHPLPLGLAANSLIFALPWFALFTAVPALIRHRRARKGLCRECAYPLAGLHRCPECGLSAKP